MGVLDMVKNKLGGLIPSISPKIGLSLVHNEIKKKLGEHVTGFVIFYNPVQKTIQFKIGTKMIPFDDQTGLYVISKAIDNAIATNVPDGVTLDLVTVSYSDVQTEGISSEIVAYYTCEGKKEFTKLTI